MQDHAWIKELPVSITVSDADGTLIAMNDCSHKAYSSQGESLIGANMLGCHSQASREKLAAMMQNHATNIYTIEKNGVKKMVVHTPWYVDGVYSGHVEFVFTLPETIPHCLRQS
ncbi:MAG: hypothetical protein GYA48_08585 [Chloroflexi bacterium]|nr:hypothetical protein [Chloroflexota bacterium]